MKILIINAYSWVNKGDFGIRVGMIKALKGVFGPDTQIKIVSSTSHVDRVHYKKYGVAVIDWELLKNFASPLYIKLFHSFWMALVISIYAIIYRFTKFFKKNTLIGAYAESDIIISPGGGFISDNFVVSTLIPNLFQISIAILMGKPFVIYAQSIGPFNTYIWSFFTRIILNHAQLITVREKISKDWLTKIGVIKPQIYITADAAFTLNASTQKEVDEIFIKECIPHENIVGLTPVYWPFPKSDNKELKYRNYVDALSETVDYLVNHKKLNVLIIPQVTDVRNIGENGDKITVKDISQRIQSKKNVFILKGDYTPEELIGIYGRMKIFVGTRMHSNIFALIAGVPCVAIAYEHKTEGIMKEWNLDKWVLSIEDIDSHMLITKIENLLAEEKSIRLQIKNKYETIKEKSLSNATLLKNSFE